MARTWTKISVWIDGLPEPEADALFEAVADAVYDRGHIDAHIGMAVRQYPPSFAASLPSPEEST